MPTANVRPDGGRRVTTADTDAYDIEIAAPLVPDLS
jgi:hypothetical protein